MKTFRLTVIWHIKFIDFVVLVTHQINYYTELAILQMSDTEFPGESGIEYQYFYKLASPNFQGEQCRYNYASVGLNQHLSIVQCFVN
ncbi:hypothetical protein WA1_05260 [Scytonema hofmannii PCC 7110]|uniref:Uncharacterized protein n=1 Tax=Scytonema hofmannii PCC 7110 TaxID=128403 RepID=A0A139WZM0_9CYAN|nr:hypothetical protein WA1_05260 [Scytonema hofmannii PCC 7110]